MGEPIIQANASLVRNGEFREGYSDWLKGPDNPNWLSRVVVDYEKEEIYCLTAGNRASVSQMIDVPKDLRADARYVLGFLCQSQHYAAGRLEISIEGSTEPAQVITIPPGSRQANKEPVADEFKPEVYNVELTQPLKRNDKIRVSVFSPPSQDDEYGSLIYITRIHLFLNLGPLVLQHLTVDGEPVSKERPLYLCLGAIGDLQHTLGVVPAPDNAWLDTDASLNSDDNPQGAIVATPRLGQDHPLDTLWSLHCPVIEGDEPHEFWFNLLNKYTAEAYPIRASLGHHRLKFGEVKEAAYYPVFEYKQSVQLGVQVVSHYTGRSLAGKAVTWSVNGERQRVTLLTNEDGWVYFTFEPSAAGEFVIEASVVSLYYPSGVFTQLFDVWVLATDPWKEVMAVVGGVAALWDEKTGYPNRGTEYPVTLKLPDSLLGTELWLLWVGDSPVELGVRVNPPLKERVPVTIAELIWMLTCEDHLDGKFELLLGCSKLLLDSSKKPMSLARNVVEIGEVRAFNTSPVVDEGGRALVMVQVLHVRTSGPGDPVVNALVDFVGPHGSESTVTGAGGWASFFDTPDNADPYTITAEVRAHADMSPIEQTFDVTPLASSSWKGNAEFYLDGEPVDLVSVGIACLRGESPAFRVTPTAGSPVKDKPMTLTLRDGDPDWGLTIGTPTPTPEGGWEWRLSSVFGSSRSGLIEFSLKSDALPETRTLSGRLLSRDLKDEATVLFDQVSATLGNQTLFPCLAAVHDFNFLVNVLSPLIGLNAMLRWSGTPASALGATVTPALDLPQVISAGGARWALDFTASPNKGQFALALELPQLKLMSTANEMQLGHNKVRIEALHESAVDPVAGQDRTWQWVRVISSFTRLPVAQVPVKWMLEGTPSEVQTDAGGWSGYAVEPATAKQYEVEAVVDSRYDSYQDKRAMTFKALASDPWEDVEVSFDRKPPQLLGTRAFFPRRKGEHQIELMVKEACALFDQEVTLGLTGTGPTALDLRFSPPLGAAQRFVDGKLSYTLKCGDRTDGSFALRLAASRLQNLSAANAMSLGEGSQVLSIIVNNDVHQTLDWGQALFQSVTVVSAISGKPMAGWAVTWHNPDLGEVTTVTDFYGVASISFTPVTTGKGELTATVGDLDHSASVSLAFGLNEPRKIIELIEVNNDKTDVGRESEARVQAKVVSSRTGEPLKDVEVKWDVNDHALPSSRTDANGLATLTFVLPAEEKVVVWATVKGGVVGWDTASLLYGGVVPAIESLTCDRPVTYTGYEVNAWATVLGVPGGRPLKGIKINWSYAGRLLPDSVSGDDGVAPVTFVTSDTGEHDLVATLNSGLPGSKTQRITVQPLQAVRVYGMSANPLTLRVGESSDIVATVRTLFTLKPVEGRKVHWKIDNKEFDMTYTNALGKASVLFHAIQAGTVTIWGHVYNLNNEEVGSVDLNIIE